MSLTTFIAMVAGVCIVSTAHAASPPPEQPHAGALQLAISRLGVVGNVLYVAAHPDDENTRLIAYLVGERRLRTGYLSLTRGDGGQNLIGAEQGELFGLIRTQELLRARRLDGGEQMFTRAVDFGYSKRPEEALELWGREEVLADVTWAIRTFRPDVVLTRFPLAGDTHGHHTASAILAVEASEAAADPARFPEQVARAGTWQPRRVLWNKSTWWKKPDEDWSGDLPVDVGGYNPLLGASYGEIAGASRSMHKSQGFGAARERGPILEYFEVLAGDRPEGDFLAGIDFSWRRAGGDDALVELLERAERTFRPDAPHEVVPLLLEARAKIRALPDSHFKAYKLGELDDVIAACAGLWLEATADGHVRAPGESVEVTATALNRSPFAFELLSLRFPGGAGVDGPGPLRLHEPATTTREVAIERDAGFTTPYWLREPRDGELYRTTSLDLLGRPESPAPLAVELVLRAGAETLRYARAVDYKWVDPVEGERRRPFEIAPAVTLQPDRRVMMFPDGSPRRLRVTAKAGAARAEGTLRVEAPAGWTVEPQDVPLSLAAREAESSFDFVVTPPAGRGQAQAGELRAVAVVGGERLSQRMTRVEYPHIPIQTVFSPAAVRVVPFDLERGVDRVGYVEGAGDEVAESLRQVGYEVVELDVERLTRDDGVLEGLDAVVVGPRAYNVNPRLRFAQDRLLRWVESGGTLVTQYNAVNRTSSIDTPLGPHPFEIGRERITDERAPVRFVDPGHELLSSPNRLSPADFDGWVQERGLYFARAWDDRYETPLASRDPGEDELLGGVLVARHGKGRFVYTGLSFFRQLPAGVPGAYRLFANMVAHGRGSR